MQPEGLWQQRAFLTITFSSPGRACVVIVRHPILPPCPPNKGKEEMTNEKIHSVCPARPPPPRHRSKLHQTSITYIHRRGLRSPVLARGLGPPRSSWALRSPIALLLFSQLRSMESARRCPPPCGVGGACRNWSKNRPPIAVHSPGQRRGPTLPHREARESGVGSR